VLIFSFLSPATLVMVFAVLAAPIGGLNLRQFQLCHAVMTSSSGPTRTSLRFRNWSFRNYIKLLQVPVNLILGYFYAFCACSA
jgi:hypothetical protein